MDTSTRTLFEQLLTADGSARYEALNEMLALTDEPVDWAYEVWDELLTTLAHKDGHLRSIAAQLLCNLAKSDPEGRMGHDFETILAVTRDPKFVTARHTLQAIWKVGAVGGTQQEMVQDRLAARFAACAQEKNHTLIRYDIIVGLRNLYDVVADPDVMEQALSLIDSEPEPKYRKKYAGVWK